MENAEVRGDARLVGDVSSTHQESDFAPPAHWEGAKPITILDLALIDDAAQTTPGQRQARSYLDGRPREYSGPEALYAAGLEYFAERDAAMRPVLLSSGKVVMTRGRPYTIAGLALALNLSLQQLLVYEQRPEFTEVVRRLKTVVLDNAIEKSYTEKGPGALAQARYLGINPPPEAEARAGELNVLVQVRLQPKVEPPPVADDAEVVARTIPAAAVSNPLTPPLLPEEQGLTKGP